MSVISVRVDSKVKAALVRAGVDVSKRLKQFLEELAWETERRERLKALEKSLRRIPPARRGFAAKSVREDREGH